MELNDLDTPSNPDRPYAKQVPFSVRLRRMSLGALPDMPMSLPGQPPASAAEVEDDPEFTRSTETPYTAAEYAKAQHPPSSPKSQLQVPGVKSLSVNISNSSLLSSSNTARGDKPAPNSPALSRAGTPPYVSSRIGSPTHSGNDDVTPQSFITLSRKRRQTGVVNSTANADTTRRLKQAEDKLTTLLSCMSVQELLIGGQRTLISRLRDLFQQYGTAQARAHTEQLGLALLASCEERDRLKTEHGLLLDLSQHYYETSLAQQHTIEDLKAALARADEQRAELIQAHEQERNEWQRELDTRDEEAAAQIDAAHAREGNTVTATTAVIQRLQAAVQMLSEENERLTRQLRQPQLALGLLAQTPVVVGTGHGHGDSRTGFESSVGTRVTFGDAEESERLTSLRTLAAIERGAFNGKTGYVDVGAPRSGESGGEVPAWKQYRTDSGTGFSLPDGNSEKAPSRAGRTQVRSAGANTRSSGFVGVSEDHLGVTGVAAASRPGKSRNLSPGKNLAAARAGGTRTGESLPPLFPSASPAAPTAANALPSIVTASYKDAVSSAPVAVKLPNSQTRMFVAKRLVAPMMGAQGDADSAQDQDAGVANQSSDWDSTARASLLQQLDGMPLPEDRHLGAQYQGQGDGNMRLRKYVSSLPATRALGESGYAVVTKAMQKVIEAAQQKRKDEEVKRAQEKEKEKVKIGKEDVEALLRLQPGRETPVTPLDTGVPRREFASGARAMRSPSEFPLGTGSAYATPDVSSRSVSATPVFRGLNSLLTEESSSARSSESWHTRPQLNVRCDSAGSRSDRPSHLVLDSHSSFTP